MLLSKPLPKPVRTATFVLGLSMLTLAGAYNHVHHATQPVSEAQISQCKDSGSSGRALAGPTF